MIQEFEASFVPVHPPALDTFFEWGLAWSPCACVARNSGTRRIEEEAMCAEIYIEKLFNDNREKVERYLTEAIVLRDAELPDSSNHEIAHCEVLEWERRLYDNAYFRDSYDGLCLLNQIGLSYLGDVVMRLYSNDQLDREGITWLLHEVSTRRLECKFLRTEEYALAHELRGENDNSRFLPDPTATYPADVLEFLVYQKLRLCSLLRTPLDIGEPVVCSL